MNLNIDKQEFYKALQVGGIFAGRNKSIPISNCIKFSVKNNAMSVISTDCENFISKKIHGIESDADGSFCLDAHDVTSYVKLMAEGTFSLAVEGSKAEIGHPDGKISLPAYPADDFPQVNSEGFDKEFVVDASIIKEWIENGRNFVSTDSLRPTMQGIYIYSQDGEMGCCATDSVFMYVDNIAAADMQDFDFILNGRAFGAVICAASSSKTLKLRISSRNVMFVGEGITVSAIMQTGKFPNFKSVIPNDTPVELCVDKMSMNNALARCSVCANKNIASANVKYGGGETMDVSCSDMDFNKSATEKVSATQLRQGEVDINAYMNLPRLLSILDGITTEDMVIGLTDARHVFTFREVKPQSNKLYILCPSVGN